MAKVKREIDLTKLPKKSNGRRIDWWQCIGYKVKFIYGSIEGYVEITDIKKGNNNIFLYIKYKNYQKIITTVNFSRCELGGILKTRTSDFKIEIGTKFKDDKRDLIITDREIRIRYDKKNSKHNERWYKYICRVCGWTEGWMLESDLFKGVGCSCCSGYTVVEGINDIPTTAPWMIKYFQGGYEEAKLYTKHGGGNPNNRGGKIHPVCFDCGRVKDKMVTINSIYQTHSISCSCSENIPYPEKFMFSVLEQLKLDFKTQLTKANFEWCNKYRYDFYVPSLNIIIETHGLQHYEDCSWNKKEKTQENDKFKKELALANGVKEENYIVIDCRYSTLEWIRDNEDGILHSRLNELFDLTKINWLKVEEFALSNLVKIAYEYKRNNPELSYIDISKMMNFSISTISKWIARGRKIWEEQTPKKENKKNNIKNNKLRQRKIICIETKQIFESAMDCERQSLNLFGFKLDSSTILKVCKGIRKHTHNLHFKYI